MKNIAVLFFTALFVFSGINVCAHMSEEAKIEYLIASVKKTPKGTKFVRNGKEYDSERASRHLKTKYTRAKKHAATAELFIENISSKSSVTGIEYSVRFADGETMTAREFFTEKLKEIEQPG